MTAFKTLPLLALLSGAAVVAAAAEGPGRPANCPEPVAAGVISSPVSEGPAPVEPNPTPPKLIKKVNPEMPSSIRSKRGVRVSVFVQGTIDIDGYIGDLSILRCTATKNERPLPADKADKLCADGSAAAKMAVSQWRYEPGLVDGRKACVPVTHQIKFTPL